MPIWPRQLPLLKYTGIKLYLFPAQTNYFGPPDTGSWLEQLILAGATLPLGGGSAASKEFPRTLTPLSRCLHFPFFERLWSPLPVPSFSLHCESSPHDAPSDEADRQASSGRPTTQSVCCDNVRRESTPSCLSTPEIRRVTHTRGRCSLFFILTRAISRPGHPCLRRDI